MSDYDIYLREAGVNGGEWAGFALAWKGLAGIEGLPARPHRRWFPWILDPAQPDNPAAGHRGVLQWRFTVALVDGLVGLRGRPPDDGRSASQMRADLLAFMPGIQVDLMDVDGTIDTVRMTAYTEWAIETWDNRHPNGGMLAEVEFVRVTSDK